MRECLIYFGYNSTNGVQPFNGSLVILKVEKNRIPVCFTEYLIPGLTEVQLAYKQFWKDHDLALNQMFQLQTDSQNHKYLTCKKG